MKTLNKIIFGIGTFLTLNNSIKAQDFQDSLVSNISSILESTEYIFKQKEIISNANKPTMYIVFQVHDDSYTDNEISRLLTMKNQLSILGILDYLYREKNVKVICAEGRPFEDDPISKEDEEVFKSIYSETKDNYKTLEEKIDLAEDFLQEFPEFGSDELFQFFYGDVFLTGFEDEKSKEFFKQRDYYAEHPEEYTEKIKGELWDTAKKHAPLRSLDALKYCPSNVDKLYGLGLIKKKDFAIVIGVGHARDYIKLAEEVKQGKKNFNLALIYPQGVQIFKNSRNELDFNCFDKY